MMELWYSLLDLLPVPWLSMNFMKNALLAVLIMGPLFGLLSTMIVTGKMSFFSDALGHSGFTGIAIGVLCGSTMPIGWAVALAVAFALLFSYVRGKTSHASETIISVFSSTAVALGIFIATMNGSSFTKFNQYLIGDILSVTPEEIGLLALVLIAAISSAISLIEVIVTMIIDRNADKGKTSSRSKITGVVCVIITAVACLVAADGLGSTGIAPINLLNKINPDIPMAVWNDCWLDFMDTWSEGLAMPIGAMIMALIIGWEQGPDSLYDEIKIGYKGNLRLFYVICIRFIVPVAMAFIAAGQIADFFGNVVAGYIIAGVLLVVFWVLTVLSGQKLKKG